MSANTLFAFASNTLRFNGADAYRLWRANLSFGQIRSLNLHAHIVIETSKVASKRDVAHAILNNA